MYPPHRVLKYTYTVNEGPVRIQYKCLVLIYVLPEMKLCLLVISKVLSPNFHVYVSVSDLYVPRDWSAYFAAAK